MCSAKVSLLSRIIPGYSIPLLHLISARSTDFFRGMGCNLRLNIIACLGLTVKLHEPKNPSIRSDCTWASWAAIYGISEVATTEVPFAYMALNSRWSVGFGISATQILNSAEICRTPESICFSEDSVPFTTVWSWRYLLMIFNLCQQALVGILLNAFSWSRDTMPAV